MAQNYFKKTVPFKCVCDAAACYIPKGAEMCPLPKYLHINALLEWYAHHMDTWHEEETCRYNQDSVKVRFIYKTHPNGAVSFLVKNFETTQSYDIVTWHADINFTRAQHLGL